MKQPKVIYGLEDPYSRIVFVTSNRLVANRAIRILSERGWAIKHFKPLSSRSVEKLLTMTT